MTPQRVNWLLERDEPWPRYRTLVDLLGRSLGDAEVIAARKAMLAHPQVKTLVAEAAALGERAFTRHNDAGYPIYKLSTLADFGVQASDRGMAATLRGVLAHQSSEGAFQSLVNIPTAFGGTGQDTRTWVVCDAPTLLYALLAMGKGQDQRIQRAVDHLAGCVDENGWRCVAAPELGKFHGPGKRADPCPVANVYALKALAQLPEWADSPAARSGVEMLLGHWQHRKTTKYYLFGMGSDFRKLKYPFVWYDLLHVLDVLSRFPAARADRRYEQMIEALTSQADAQGRYTATSMYQSWKGWSFADKKNPSPWLTFLALRILKRSG